MKRARGSDTDNDVDGRHVKARIGVGTDNDNNLTHSDNHPARRPLDLMPARAQLGDTPALDDPNQDIGVRLEDALIDTRLTSVKALMQHLASSHAETVLHGLQALLESTKAKSTSSLPPDTLARYLSHSPQCNGRAETRFFFFFTFILFVFLRCRFVWFFFLFF